MAKKKKSLKKTEQAVNSAKTDIKPELDQKDAIVDRKEIKPDKAKAEKIIDIFQTGNKEKIDMTKIDRRSGRSRGKIFLIFIVILFILAGASVAGFFVFNQDFSNQEEANKVELKIKAVDAMASGEQIKLEITYENKDSVAIKQGNVTIHYPAGFYWQEAVPTPTSSDNSWDIANIAPGAAGKITITGQMVGELQEEKKFTGFLTYQPDNFQSDFQDTTDKTITINNTIVTLEASVPDMAFSGQEIEYQVKFKNTASLALPNVKIIIEYPKDFTIKSAEPTAETSNSWKLAELKPQAEQTIKLKGVIKGDNKENKEFKFKLGLEEPDGKFNLQVEKTNLILIVNPEIKLSLQAPEFISLGEEIEYKIKIENISDIVIENLQMKLNFTEGLTDKKTISLSKIDSLPNNQQKELSEKIKVKNKNSDQATSLKAILTIDKATVEKKEFTFTDQTEATSKIKANLNYSASARYYDDDLTRLGSGPIPPQVGKTTSYVIYWEASAVGGDLNNIDITTSLPDYIDKVEFDKKKINYDKEKKQIKWHVDKLISAEKKKISFTIFATPTKDQLNKLLILTKETVINASDSNTKENISQSMDKITSDLPLDPAAAGKGVVEK